MMDKKEFAAYVHQQVTGMLPAGEYPEGTSVAIIDVDKGGKQKLTGLSIRKPGENISPCIYLDEHFEAYKKGAPVSLILEEIVREDRQARKNIKAPEMTEKDIAFEAVRDRLYIQVCDTRMSQGYLKDRPHTEVGDMSATYYIIVGRDGRSTQSMGIVNSLFDEWGITLKELHQAAAASIRRHMPTRMYDLNELMGQGYPDITKAGDLIGEVPAVRGDNPMSLYVLTNDQNFYGASAIFDSKVLEQAATGLGADCFILPSSVHEIMLVPDDGKNRYEELAVMVSDINQYGVSDQDFLSDRVQYYDRSQKKVLSRQEYLERRERLSREPQKEQEIKQRTPKI